MKLLEMFRRWKYRRAKCRLSAVYGIVVREYQDTDSFKCK